MKNEREIAIRQEIMMQVYASRPLALAPATMERQARKAQLDYSADEFARESAFLHGQELLQPVRDAATGVVRYAISSKGTMYYEENF